MTCMDMLKLKSAEVCSYL
uniref:Uncharacterized protein n=1 Tax=Anguilla anguilla TaxID=7936 RepID=A0A0E9PXD2_ANGAN